MAITITINEKPATLDTQITQRIPITLTGHTEWEVTAQDLTGVNVVTVEKNEDNTSFNISTLSTGVAMVKVTSSNNGENAQDIWNVQVDVVETTLSITNIINEMRLGSEHGLNINTNAKNSQDDTEARYTVESEDTSVVRVKDKSKNILQAVGRGSTTITVKAKKWNSIEKVTTWRIDVKYAESTTDTGLPTSIDLYNERTKRTVKFVTTDNEATDDVTLYLPNRSGNLVTEQELEDDIRAIQTPVIVTPATGTLNWVHGFKASEYAVRMGYSVPHTGTVWELAHDLAFTQIVARAEYTSVHVEKGVIKDLTQTDLSIAGITGIAVGTFAVRVKYVSNDFESHWSKPIVLQFNNSPQDISKQALSLVKSVNLAGKEQLIQDALDGYTCGYFGEIPYADLVPYYDYRGDLETIYAALANGDSSNATRKSQGYKKNTSWYKAGLTYEYCAAVMKKGYSVTYKGKLYYATESMQNGVTEVSDGEFDFKMIFPDDKSTDNKWKLDDRTGLGTIGQVMSMIGIGFGYPDSNCDGLSINNANNVITAINTILDITKTGSSKWDQSFVHSDYIYPEKPTTAPNAKGIGYLENRKEGYIKYSYQGKICYTPIKPICNEIAWTDIAKRDAVYGYRTLRLGKYYYKIRLMKEDEYKKLFGELLKDEANATTKYGLDKKIWIEDFQEGAKRKVITGTGTVSEVDPKLRTGQSYRFVLEWLPVEDLPAYNLKKYFPKMCSADIEDFQYDPITDTGYFGFVSKNRFITPTELMTKVPFSGGVLLDESRSGWLKFYWHGYIVYMSKVSIRNNISYTSINNNQYNFGIDMGGSGKKMITIDGVDYRVNNISGSMLSPYTITDINYGNGQDWKMSLQNSSKEKGKYSMQQELLCRVVEGYQGYEEVTKYGTIWKYAGGSDYPQLYNSIMYQAGNNWTNYTGIDLRIFYRNDTSGWNAPIAKEHGNTLELHLDHCGATRWSGSGALDGADTYTSLRSLISLDPITNTNNI